MRQRIIAGLLACVYLLGFRVYCFRSEMDEVYLILAKTVSITWTATIKEQQNTTRRVQMVPNKEASVRRRARSGGKSEAEQTFDRFMAALRVRLFAAR